MDALTAEHIYQHAAEMSRGIGPITQIILQPTTFCNLRCKYCYLSIQERQSRLMMPDHMPADVLKYIIDSGIANTQLEFRWHAGEPLSAGLEYFSNAVSKMQRYTPPEFTVLHTIQTNGTYLNDAWCEFFKKYRFRVGVSIDGPACINDKYRVTRSNKGAHFIIMRGINFLKKHNIDFDIIAVVTKDSLAYPNEFYEFFKDIKPARIGLNIEETDAQHVSKSTDGDFSHHYYEFLKVIHRRASDDNIQIRELSRIKRSMEYSDKKIVNLLTTPFMIFCVNYKGDFTTFNPELLGQTHSSFGSFNLGNIYKDTIDNVLESHRYKNLNRSIQEGVQACKNKCPYFKICGGGTPSNKLYENGSFESTETFHCKSKIQTPANILLESFEAQRKHG